MLEKIQSLVTRHDALERELATPEAMERQGHYRRILQEHGALRRLKDLWTEYQRVDEALTEAREIITAGDDADLVELARDELPSHETRHAELLEKLRRELVSEDADDGCDVIMDLQAGTGGDEAGLFVGDLTRLYERVADRKGWSVEVLGSTAAKSGGFKSVTLGISGSRVHRELKFESGGHRVQRVPATESQGRIHTSLATVVVLPEVEDVEIEIAESDVRIETFCASGPGGQHVNKTESAVRLIHEPTGLKVECQDEKSQHMNKQKAWRVLRARVTDHFREIRERERGEKRLSLRGSGDRSERIRTYNFPQNRVTDHRVGVTLYSLDRFMEGEVDELLEALHSHRIAEKLAAL